jgi:hypothetical protein
MPPDPPRKPRNFVARSMTNNFGLATPLETKPFTQITTGPVTGSLFANDSNLFYQIQYGMHLTKKNVTFNTNLPISIQ